MNKALRVLVLGSSVTLLFAVAPGSANAQSQYTITQITNDHANHESPSINDKGQIVWSELSPLGGALLWQVFERDIRTTNQNGVLVPVPDPNHNFQFPVIDNAGDIVYLKDHAGAGVALEVVKNKAGSETIIEFSSIDPNSGAARVAGKHFGISSNGTVISYFDFCLQTCTQTFDVSGTNSIPGNLIQYFVPSINDNSTFAFVFNHQVCTAPTNDPINGRNCIGPGDLPRITNPQLHFSSLTGQIAADPEVVYISGGQVISTFGGVIDSGSWAGVNNLGMIVYEKAVNGFNQIFVATPYWQQCHTDPLTLHWGPERYAAQPNESICGYGCLTTALSRSLATYGVLSLPIMNAGQLANDPGNLNTFMDQNVGDYAGDNVQPDIATHDVGVAINRPNLKFDESFYGEIWDPAQPTSPASMKAISDLESTVAIGNRPVIVYVTPRPTARNPHPTFGPHFHFVVVTGVVRDTSCTSYSDGTFCIDFLISDPFGTPTVPTSGALNTPNNLPYTTLSQYGQFGIRGFVMDPPDNSALDFAVTENATLLVVDSLGRRTGLDPATGTILREIPNSTYFDTSVDDEDSFDAGHVFGPPTSTTHSVDIFQPSTGSYTVVINGTQAGSYMLPIRAFSQDGTAQPPVTLQGNANASSTSTTNLQFSPVPGSTLMVTSSDKTPPVTTATASPQPNTAGWNNSDVTITLNSTDSEAGGSGVKQITYSASGAQNIANSVVNSASASFTISMEGITTIAFFGTDNAGNIETAKTITVQLDKTPPTISGSRTPPANANGWNNTSVTVNFACADGLSGLAAGSPPAPTTLSSEGAGQSVTGTCADVAGNSASATVGGINIDKTAPVVTASANPLTLWPPNGKMVNVTVSGTMTDNLSGVNSNSATFAVVDSYGLVQPSGNFTVSANGTYSFTVLLEARRDGQDKAGRLYTITVSAQDNAGNQSSVSTAVVVPHDQGQ